MPAPSQYADDSNLRARQRIWSRQEPAFDLLAWVVELADIRPSMPVLDLGCGNGSYLARLEAVGAWPVGTDASLGILASAGGSILVNGDAARLPFSAGVFDVVVAAHMLYHVAELSEAVAEIRRVLVPGGLCLAVTNGEGHVAALRRLVEAAVAESAPGWKMTDPATVAFSLENGGVRLAECFESVQCVRPPVRTKVLIDDPEVVAGYVASVADHYQPQVDCQWEDVVEDCRRAAQEVIDRDGIFTTAGDVGVFVCR